MARRRKSTQWWLLPIVSGIVGLALYAFKGPATYTSLSFHAGYLVGYTFFWMAILPVVIYAVAYIPGGIFWLIKKRQMPNMKIIIWGLFWMFVLFYFMAIIDEKNVRPSREIPLPNVVQISASELYKNLKDSVFSVNVYHKGANHSEIAGTAVAVGKDMIATNCHVIHLASRYVIVVNGKEVKGRLFSQHGDLCLVRVSGQNLKPVQLRMTVNVDVGEDVYAIGNPQGFEDSITKGIVSKTNAIIDGNRFIQSDAVIAGGSSGGGLFDAAGKLIGITTLSLKDSDGVTFAIPSEIIQAAILEPIIEVKPVEKKKANKPSEASESSEPSKSVGLIKIGVYGDDKVELYAIGKMCFMVFAGRSEEGKKRSLAIWVPRSPLSIMLFPYTRSIREALLYFARFLEGDGDLDATKDMFILEDQESRLYTDRKIVGATRVRMAAFNFNPIKILIEDDYFVGEFVDRSQVSGYRVDYYGLYGFTDSLTAYHTYCLEKGD